MSIISSASYIESLSSESQLLTADSSLLLCSASLRKHCIWFTVCSSSLSSSFTPRIRITSTKMMSCNFLAHDTTRESSIVAIRQSSKGAPQEIPSGLLERMEDLQAGNGSTTCVKMVFEKLDNSNKLLCSCLYLV